MSDIEEFLEDITDEANVGKLNIESEDLFENESKIVQNEFENAQNNQDIVADDNEITPDESNNVDKQSDNVERLIKLPLARVKHIMKLDPDVNLISQDAVFLVTKATELFLTSLARETYSYTIKGKKKTVQRKDLDAAIESVDSLCFLEGAID